MKVSLGVETVSSYWTGIFCKAAANFEARGYWICA